LYLSMPPTVGKMEIGGGVIRSRIQVSK